MSGLVIVESSRMKRGRCGAGGFELWSMDEGRLLSQTC